MPTVVVFDCESDGKPDRCGDRADFSHVQCTVACALVLEVGQPLEDGQKITCWRDLAPTKCVNPFMPLFDAFDRADVIVGFNCYDFDFPLLWKHYGKKQQRRYQEHRLKTLDVFSRIRAATGTWPKLGDLLHINDMASKTGDGAEAVRLWQQGKRDQLQKYCEMDVVLTAKLAMLPRMRMGALTIPSSVYGIEPAVQAVMMSKEQAMREEHTTPTDTTDTASSSEGEGGFVVVGMPVVPAGIKAGA